MFVRVPFFKATKAETGIESGLQELLKTAMKGDGVFALFLARVHDDGDAEWAGVGVESAVLDFALFIEAPCGLTWNAEARVIEGPKEASAGSENRCGGGCCFGQVFDVLKAQDGGGGLEGSKVMECGGIANEEATARTGVGAGFVDQGGGGVDAGSTRAFSGDGAGKDALATAEVEMGFIFGGIEEGERTRNDHLLVEVGAFFADEAIVPSSGLVPGGVSSGSARAVRARG